MTAPASCARMTAMADPARKLPPVDDDAPLEGEAWEDAWDEEIARRIGEVERGEVELIPWEDVRAEIDAKLAAVAARRAR